MVQSTAPRASRLPALLLVLMTLLLVSSTVLSAPAEAAGRHGHHQAKHAKHAKHKHAKRASGARVAGWSTNEIVVDAGRPVVLRVGVGRGRTVALQWRGDATQSWRTLARTRSNGGKSRLQLNPVAGTRSEIRVAVGGRRGFATAPRTVTALPPGGAATAAAGTTTTLTDFEAQVLALTNQARSQARSCGSEGSFGATGPVAAQGTLTNVARAYSWRMGADRFFSHQDPDGNMPWDRTKAAGYYATAVGENIASGYTTPQAVVQAWLNSPGHCSNIMNPRWTEMGIGHRVVPNSPSGTYWTQLFGTGAVSRR